MIERELSGTDTVLLKKSRTVQDFSCRGYQDNQCRSGFRTTRESDNWLSLLLQEQWKEIPDPLYASNSQHKLRIFHPHHIEGTVIEISSIQLPGQSARSAGSQRSIKRMHNSTS